MPGLVRQTKVFIVEIIVYQPFREKPRLCRIRQSPAAVLLEDIRRPPNFSPGVEMVGYPGLASRDPE